MNLGCTGILLDSDKLPLAKRLTTKKHQCMGRVNVSFDLCTKITCFVGEQMK